MLSDASLRLNEGEEREEVVEALQKKVDKRCVQTLLHV